MARRTGNTFRTLLRAIADASEGHRVFYISRQHAATKDFYFRHAIGIIAAYHGCIETITVSHEQRRIKFPTCGEIRFISGETDARDSLGLGKIKRYYDA